MPVRLIAAVDPLQGAGVIVTFIVAEESVQEVDGVKVTVEEAPP